MSASKPHEPQPAIVVKRENYFRGHGRLHPYGWLYSCTGPDGTQFTNDSIAELRRVLRFRYGREVLIEEPWKAATA